MLSIWVGKIDAVFGGWRVGSGLAGCVWSYQPAGLFETRVLVLCGCLTG